MTPRILVVDDDAHIREVIRFAAEDASMQVAEAADGRQALAKLSQIRLDLVILDIGMPEMDGFEACKAIRQNSDVPILFLTARDDEIDRVLGFQLGGDDYVSKPFSPRELVLRIRAILGRGRREEEVDSTLERGDLFIDPDRHICRLGDSELPLTGIEFNVLAALARASDRLLTRSQLIEAVYGPNTYLSDRTVDSHIRNVRQKALDAGYSDVIQTVRGVGLKIGGCAA